MSESKAIDKANLELALSENNNRIKNYVSNRIHNVDIAQKTVNTELDYCVCYGNDDSTEIKANVPNMLIHCNIRHTNLEFDEEGYVLLKANKKYMIFADFAIALNANSEIVFTIVDKEGNTYSNLGWKNPARKTSVDGVACTGFVNFEQDTYIGIKVSDWSNKGAATYSAHMYVTIQEIGREIVIDPVEHVNVVNGIEDTPVGHVMSCMSINAPKHYLICDGTEYNISDYPHLAQHFMNEFGKYNYFGGDGVNTFAVPTIISQVNVETNANVLESEQLVVKFEELTGRTDSFHISDMTITQNELKSSEYFIRLTDKTYLVLKKFKANVIGLVDSYKTASGGTTSEGAFYQYRNNVLIKSLFYKAPTNTIGSTGTAEDIFDFEEGDTFYFCTPSTSGWPQQYGTIEIYLNFTKYLHCIKYEPTYFYADTVQNNDPELEQIIGQLGLILDDINGEVV